DDDALLRRLGMTIENISEAFEAVIPTWNSEHGVERAYRGYSYLVRVESDRGSVQSPFSDGLSTSLTITIKNLNLGTSIAFSGLLPHFIKRYGFFEGHGTPFRLDPREIHSVFPFLGDPAE